MLESWFNSNKLLDTFPNDDKINICALEVMCDLACTCLGKLHKIPTPIRTLKNQLWKGNPNNFFPPLGIITHFGKVWWEMFHTYFMEKPTWATWYKSPKFNFLDQNWGTLWTITTKLMLELLLPTNYLVDTSPIYDIIKICVKGRRLILWS